MNRREMRKRGFRKCSWLFVHNLRPNDLLLVWSGPSRELMLWDHHRDGYLKEVERFDFTQPDEVWSKIYVRRGGLDNGGGHEHNVAFKISEGENAVFLSTPPQE